MTLFSHSSTSKCMAGNSAVSLAIDGVGYHVRALRLDVPRADASGAHENAIGLKMMRHSLLQRVRRDARCAGSCCFRDERVVRIILWA